MQHASFIYHQDWEIIENNTCVPYVTSDNPVGLIPCDDIRRPPIRLVALTPRLGFAFRATNTQPPPFDPAGTGPRGKIQWRASDENGVRMFNDVIAKCAEDLVLSSAKSDEVAAMVARCARFRVEAEYVELPADEPDAVYQGTIIRVREAQRA
jgi:hypothetical protein